MYSIGFKTDAAISDLKKNKKFKQVSENEMSLLWFCKNKKIKKQKRKHSYPGQKRKTASILLLTMLPIMPPRNSNVLFCQHVNGSL